MTTTTETDTMKYGVMLGWFDDEKHKPLSDKLNESIEAYERKFGSKPNLALVNEKDAQPVAGWEVKVSQIVRPNHYWIGRTEKPVEGLERLDSTIDPIAYVLHPRKQRERIRKPAPARRKG